MQLAVGALHLSYYNNFYFLVVLFILTYEDKLSSFSYERLMHDSRRRLPLLVCNKGFKYERNYEHTSKHILPQVVDKPVFYYELNQSLGYRLDYRETCIDDHAYNINKSRQAADSLH
jgi:hypothetical protein